MFDVLNNLFNAFKEINHFLFIKILFCIKMHHRPPIYTFGTSITMHQKVNDLVLNLYYWYIYHYVSKSLIFSENRVITS